MPRQKVPDIDFDYFVFSQILDLYDKGKIFINTDYQRGDVWKYSQKIELIKSISNSYSIGVLVLFKNEDDQYEILDGQQRLLTIIKYLKDEIDLREVEISKYSELDKRERTLLDAYCIYYIKLKSHNPDSKEEDIIQTFLRLQEGTPLNKAEKINAYRGEFKNAFRKVREEHPVFKYLGREKRFRWRQLAAEMLLIELESDFNRKIFTDIDLKALTNASKKYEKKLSNKRLSFFVGTLDLMNQSLNILLTAFSPREMIAFYLLISYLRKNKANNSNLVNEIYEFAIEFLKNLNSFSIYDSEPPEEMSLETFNTYKEFKQESKILTSSESIRKRFDIMLGEFDRLKPIIYGDPNRFHDTEQKRILFFRQGGICPECNKPMVFSKTTSHHIIAHKDGGITDDLNNAVLLHEKCHGKIEKRLQKNNK